MRMVTRFTGELVGKDADGNTYYQTRRAPQAGGRRKRWVLYNGPAEASVIPPEWHAWLHHTTDEPIALTGRRPWQKPHLPNLTGTPEGYRPPGSDYLGGKRAPATGDYEAWTPGS